MRAQYLLRFDDICATMNWQVWSCIEAMLDRVDVRPIIAVVPDNRDAKLTVQPAIPDFWARVRSWQTRGWTIGWHGYQHDYCTSSRGVIGIHDGSEFAGLAEIAQRKKLQAAAEIFEREGVTPRVWVAPGHSFDDVTIRLLPEFNIHVISDGFYWRPISERQCTWIPQQLWRLRRMPFGMWTVCLHVNSWTESDLNRFGADLQRFAGSIVPLESALEVPARRAGFLDDIFNDLFRRAVLAKMRVRKHNLE